MPNNVTNSTPKAGELLLADPFLPDSNFSRSVVLLTECNDEGSVGFVLNRPLEISLQSVIADDIGTFDSPLFYGGPVEPDTLHYFHSLGEALEGAVKVSEGVFWGGSFETLRILLSQGQVDRESIRFFIGYSGWGTNQLQDEMNENSWIKASLWPPQVFSPNPSQLWMEVMTNLGGRYKQMATYPMSPRLN